MKIFYKGYYGFSNLGDDIFVHTIKWFSDKYNHIYKIHGYNLPDNINGKKVKNKFEKIMCDLYYSLTCKGIIYWGGSTFENSGSISDLRYYITRIKYLRKKTLAFGISLGPFKNSNEKRNVLDNMNKLNYVGVRDITSLKYDSKFEFTFDLAVILPYIFKFKEQEKRSQKIISVNLSKANNLEEYKSLYKDFILFNKEKISKVNIIVFNSSDFKISKEFYDEFKNEHISIDLIKYTTNTEYILGKVVESDLILGSRLHSGIIAYAYKIPFILNEYHEKCSDFVNTVNQRFDYNKFKFTKDKSINHVIEKASEFKNPESFRDIILNQFENISKEINRL